MTRRVRQFLHELPDIDDAFKELKEKGWVSALFIRHSIETRWDIEITLDNSNSRLSRTPHPDDINPRLSEIADKAAECLRKYDLDGADLEPDPRSDAYAS
jgi:hypothetical protein